MVSGLDITRRRLEATRKQFGESHPKTVEAAHQLAIALSRDAGRRREALELYRRLTTISVEVLGADTEETLRIHHETAELEFAFGNLTAAQARLLDVLVRRERVSGSDHLETLRVAESFGVVLLALGQAEEAAAVHRDVAARLEQLFGATHRDTLASRNNLANALRAAGRAEEATEIFRALVEVAERVHGADSAEAVRARSNLAAALVDLGKGVDAAELLQDVVRALEGVDDHRELLASARNNLATALHQLGRYREAEMQLRRSVAEQEVAQGPDHPETINAVENLARVLAGLGIRDEAVRLARRCQEFYANRYPLRHPRSQGVRELLAGLA